MDATHALKILYWNEITNSAQQAIRCGQYEHKEKEHMVILIPMENYQYEWEVVEKLCYPHGSTKCVGPLLCTEGVAHRTYILPKTQIDR